MKPISLTSLSSAAALALMGSLALAQPLFAANSADTQGNPYNGTFLADHDIVRSFAGTFKGDFTPSDCQSGAEQVYGLWSSSGKSVVLNDSVNVVLDNDHRFLIIGVEDETESQWSYVCVNVTADGSGTEYYFIDQGPFASSGWVDQIVDLNGYKYHLKFADQNNGSVTFGIPF